jgi:hypothetical protein
LSLPWRPASSLEITIGAIELARSGWQPVALRIAVRHPITAAQLKD